MRTGLNFNWLKRFMPRGLYGRAALILFLPLVTLMLVVSVTFLQRHFEGVTRQMTASMVQELAFVADRVNRADSLAAAQRAGREVAAPLGLSLELPAPENNNDQRQFFDLSGLAMITELRASPTGITGIDLGNDRRVRVTMSSRWGPMTLEFERRRVTASNPHQLLVLMVFTSILMSVIAGLFLRNQVRPIRRLAQAAENFGRGRVTPFRPSGATEIRSAGAAFLDMRNRIERQIEQRTLMLSGVSHDLRTPLTRLRLGLSMLSPDMPPDEDEITAMERDVAEMNRMIDAFLAVARDDAQIGPPEERAALPFVRSVVEDAQRAGQNVMLTRAEGDPAELVTFRPDALRRAMENLIGNAVRYGQRVEVEVALGPRSLRITIEDDGPGIPADRVDEAMRPFTRLDPARNQNLGGGAGLGLSIAADAARAHGGQLRLGRSDRLGGLRADLVIAR